MVEILFLKRLYGDSLVLHPFRQKRDVIDLVEREPLTVVYSHEPDEDEKLRSHYVLYSLVDDAVTDWIQELKYIPRLLWSALVFILVYFFTSFVIRDFIPLIDEILISGGAAVLMYGRVASKNRKSDIASKRRIELKQLVDEGKQAVEASLVPIEEALAIYDETPLLTLADTVTGREPDTVQLHRNRTTEKLLDYLDLYLFSLNKKQKKYVRRILSLRNGSISSSERNEKEAEMLSSNLLQLGNRKTIDLPIIALYLAVKKLY